MVSSESNFFTEVYKTIWLHLVSDKNCKNIKMTCCFNSFLFLKKKGHHGKNEQVHVSVCMGKVDRQNNATISQLVHE